MPHSSVRLLLRFSAMLSVSIVLRVTARGLHDNMIGCYSPSAICHEISRLQHGLQLIMARYTRIIKCRPCCKLYVVVLPAGLRVRCCCANSRSRHQWDTMFTGTIETCLPVRALAVVHCCMLTRKSVIVQWQDPTFLTKLVWSINNHFFAFFNSS